MGVPAALTLLSHSMTRFFVLALTPLAHPHPQTLMHTCTYVREVLHCLHTEIYSHAGMEALTCPHAHAYRVTLDTRSLADSLFCLTLVITAVSLRATPTCRYHRKHAHTPSTHGLGHADKHTHACIHRMSVPLTIVNRDYWLLHRSCDACAVI